MLLRPAIRLAGFHLFGFKRKIAVYDCDCQRTKGSISAKVTVHLLIVRHSSMLVEHIEASARNLLAVEITCSQAASICAHLLAGRASFAIKSLPRPDRKSVV